jgi:hypothetical protein
MHPRPDILSVSILSASPGLARYDPAMRKGIALAGLLALSAAGCVFDGRAAQRPARFQLGVNSRHLAVRPTPDGATLARTTNPTTPEVPATPSSAVTGSAQFTMAWRYHTYVGAEAEAGTLGWSGSNFAGAYGVFGAESTSQLGSLAVELTAGQRWMRYDVFSKDVGSRVIEPRVRGELWLSPQITFGAALGATSGEGGWVAGMYLSVYSNLYNAWHAH